MKKNYRPGWFESEFSIPEADICFYSLFQYHFEVPNLAMSRFPWDFRLGDFRIPAFYFCVSICQVQVYYKSYYYNRSTLVRIIIL